VEGWKVQFQQTKYKCLKIKSLKEQFISLAVIKTPAVLTLRGKLADALDENKLQRWCAQEPIIIFFVAMSVDEFNVVLNSKYIGWCFGVSVYLFSSFLSFVLSLWPVSPTTPAMAIDMVVLKALPVRTYMPSMEGNLILVDQRYHYGSCTQDYLLEAILSSRVRPNKVIITPP
ncbi:hypothetical protein ZWY2020_029436, partial [Hordeum vulgare]